MPRNLRLKGLIVCEALLRLSRLINDHFDGDQEAFACYLAVISATADARPDQRKRRSVSRRAVANAVGYPRETVRRRIAELLDKGYLAEGDGGLEPVAPVFERAGHLQITLGAIRTLEEAVAGLQAAEAQQGAT